MTPEDFNKELEKDQAKKQEAAKQADSKQTVEQATNKVVDAMVQSTKANMKHRENTTTSVSVAADAPGTENANRSIEAINNLALLLLSKGQDKPSVNMIDGTDLGQRFADLGTTMTELLTELRNDTRQDDNMGKVTAQLDEAIKQLRSLQVAPDPDSKKSLANIENALKSIDFKPQVTVPTPKVTVQGKDVDLTPLVSLLQDIQKTLDSLPKENDDTDVVHGLEKVQGAISSLSFPVPNYVLPFKDSTGKATQVQLDAFGNLPTAGGGSSGTQYAELATTAPATGNLSLGRYKSSAPTLTDGQMYGLQLDASGNLKVTGSLSVGGTTDSAAWTAASSTFNPSGGVFNDSAAALTSGQQGTERLTPNRALHTNLRNNSGTEVATSANPLRIDPTGSTTQPVSGTVTANAGTGSFTVAQATGTNLHTVVDSGSITAIQGTATNLKTQSETYQGGVAVSAAAPLQVSLANTGSNATAVKTDSSATTQPVSGTVTANAGTNLNTSALALDATLTGGTAKSIIRGGAKGSTTAADVTSTASGANHQPVDVAIYDASGNQVTSFGGGTQYADGAARGTATGTLLMVDDGTNVQSAIGTTAGVLKVDLSATAANTTAVKTDSSATTQPISAATLPLPTGAATSAKQPALGTAGTPSADVLTVQGATSMTALKVDGSAVTQPVSGTVTANAGTNLNTSALATSTNITGGGQKTQIVDGSGNVVGSTTNALDVNIKSGASSGAVAQGSTTSGQTGGLVQGAVTTAAPTYTTAQTNPLSLTTSGALRTDASGTTQPVSGTFWQATQPVSLATNTPTLQSGSTTAVTQSTASNLKAQVTGAGTAGTADSGVVTVQGIASMTALKTDGSATTQPVSGTVTANAGTNLNTSALALDATLTGGTQQSKITDGTNVASVKAASTAAVATDKAVVVAVSPNNTVPVSLATAPTTPVTGTFFQATQPVSIATNTPTLQSGSTTAVTQATGTNLHAVIDSGSTTAVTQATAANLNATVVGTGTLSVQTSAQVPGTGATNLGKAEDAGHTTGDTGVMSLGVRNDTLLATTNATSDYTQLSTDQAGIVMTAGAPRALKGRQATTITSSTTETTIVTAVAATFLDVYGLILTNTSATATKVSVRDATAGGTITVFEVPATDTRGFMLPLDSAVPQATVNNNWTAQCGTSVASLEVTVLYVKRV